MMSIQLSLAYGVPEGKSTTYNSTTHDWWTQLDHNKDLILLCVIAFQKAFDTVQNNSTYTLLSSDGYLAF